MQQGHNSPFEMINLIIQRSEREVRATHTQLGIAEWLKAFFFLKGKKKKDKMSDISSFIVLNDTVDLSRFITSSE